MPRLHRRPAALIAGLVLLLVVAAAAVLVLRDDRPAFRVGDESGSSDDGERLMEGKRKTRQRVLDDLASRAPALVEHVGPGSAVLSFRTLILDDDAKAVRIRQRTLTDLLEDIPDAGRTSAVRWRGFVATQRPGGGSFRDSIGPWKAAGRDGVLAKPGQQVRLRTRYDLQPGGKTCRTTVLPDGPRWEMQEDGGEWTTLRAREDGRNSDGASRRDVEVRTGQIGPLAFTSARPCDEEDASLLTVTEDGTRGPGDLNYNGL